MNNDDFSFETVEEAPQEHGTLVERISKEDLVLMWEEHEHVYKADGSEETDDFYSEMCTVKNCGVGRLVSK